MNQTEFQKWCEQLQLKIEASELIARIRAAPPERRVQGRAVNVRGTYPSRKMGVTIQFESHTVELWAIYQMEHDPLVLEFYDQPPSFKIHYQSLSGRKIAHYYTPDFFVLRTDSAAWEEWKTEKQLEKLSQKYPSRYQRTEEGRWRCPPGEAYAEQFGLEYQVRTDAQLHPTFIQNLMFLEDYFTTTITVPAPIETRIRQRVGTTPGITLAALMAEESGVCTNDIYLMITTEQLYVDLSAVPLAEHWQVQLYPDRQRYLANRHLAVKLPQNFHINPNQLKANSKLLWDGKLWTLLNLGETFTTLLPELGQPMSLPTGFFLQLLDSGAISILDTTEETTVSEQLQTLMNAASPKDLETANQRYQKVQAYLQREKELYQDIAPRTLSRWVKQFRQAEALYGCDYVGLLPKTAQRGNRTPKAPETARELLDTFIKEHFHTPRQAPAASVYRAYQQACDQQNITPLSISRFYPQHLMKIGSGASAGKLLDQLDWIKSMTNMTNVLHILIGTYELLDFRDLSGQASRRDFQAALLALLKQVPLQTEIGMLMQHWVYFYERSIGCVGVLKDWLVRTVAAALDDGSATLTLELLQSHALSLAQCERMAIDTVEGEQKLEYMESRREHLWQLLKMGQTDSLQVPVTVVETPPQSTPPIVETTEPPEKSTKKRNYSKKTAPTDTLPESTATPVAPREVPPKKKRTSKKAPETAPTSSVAPPEKEPPIVAVAQETPTQEALAPKKKTSRGVGQCKPKRDKVGSPAEKSGSGIPS